MRRIVVLLAVGGALAGLLLTASRAPGGAHYVLKTEVVGFEPHAGPVVQVHVHGGSCSFSLSKRDYYSYLCDSSGSGDKAETQAVTRARPILRRHGLCITETFSPSADEVVYLVHRCGESFEQEFMGAKN